MRMRASRLMVSRQGRIPSFAVVVDGITLDALTLSDYSDQNTLSSRASLIVAAMGLSPVIEIFDGSNALRASGTFADPWATASGASVTVGQVTAALITVTSGGTPDSTWYAQIRNGARYIRMPFGLFGSSAPAVWSETSFTTGDKGRIGSFILVAAGVGAPSNTVAPAISGTAQVGNVLTASTGTWTDSPTSYAYQWQSSANGTSGWSNISGATSNTYTPVSGDVGLYLRVGVTATNAIGTGAVAYSAATSPVASAAEGAPVQLSQSTILVWRAA